MAIRTLLRSQLRLFSTSRPTMAQQPPWLNQILRDTSPPPTLYAWDPSHLNLAYTPPATNGTDDLARRIFVLGVGNLGRMYAAYLAQNKAPITLVVHRKELLRQWVEGNGIEISRLGRLYQNKEFAIEFWTEEKPSSGPIKEVADGFTLRNLLVATKASAALPEVDRARRYLDSSSTVTFTQNGMSKFWPPHGNSYLSHRYPQGNGFNVLACIANHGVLSEGPFKSRHASPANASIGPVLTHTPLPPSADYIIEQILSALFIDAKSFNSTELWIVQLEKLIVNSCLNPLTALLRVKNGYLFEKNDGIVATIISQVLQEASAVLQALVQHDSCTEILTASVPQSTETEKAAHVQKLRQDLTQRFSQAQLKEMVYVIGDRVKENTSSMLQDVRAGKKTEIRDFNGWLVDMANFIDPSLDVTTNQKLIGLVEEASAGLTVAELGAHFQLEE